MALREFPETVTAYPFGDSVHVTFRDNAINPVLYDFLEEHGVSNAEFSQTSPGIEDRFLELMNDAG
jgi:hypothetical protein